MSPEMENDPLDQGDGEFQFIPHGHRDMISAAAYNTYGDRLATSSVDGKIKVYNKHLDGSWNLCDTWGAHTAEIHQIQWLAPTIHPHLLASVAADGRFKIWAEDPTIAPNKGQRFSSRSSSSSNNKPVYEMRSPSRSPYLSFSICHRAATRQTYLALINRSGNVTVHENDEPENMELWNDVDNFVVCEPPARGEEVSFQVVFDPNLEPSYTAVRHGVPRDALGLAIASMAHASVWRTKEIVHRGSSLGHATSKEFYKALELKGHGGLVRDIAWAPGNVRGFDFIATACRDGFVRVFQVWTPGKGRSESESTLKTKEFSRVPDHESIIVLAHQTTSGVTDAENSAGNLPSGIGAGLRAVLKDPEGDSASANRPQDDGVTHMAKEVGKLSIDAGRTPVWKVAFDADGLILASTGDDGSMVLWRREPSGNWSKSSELSMKRRTVG